MAGHSHPPILDASSGAGYLTTVGGLNSYVSAFPHAVLAVILVSDIFGINAPNFRNVVDKVAAKGYYAVAPDFINNDPFDPNNASRPLSAWLQDHPPEDVAAAAKPVIDDLKRKGFAGVGASGFCWGGIAMSDLGRTKLLKAVVLVHPSFVQPNDFLGTKTPIAILGGQNDTMTPPSRVKQIEQVLREVKPKVPYFVKIFPNVEHGWSLLYDPNDPVAVKVADKTHRTMIDCFDKHLKK